MTKKKPKSKALTRPHTLADAAKKLDLEGAQTRALRRQGKLGKWRHPTPAEREKFGFAPNAWVTNDFTKTQKYNDSRYAR